MRSAETIPPLFSSQFSFKRENKPFFFFWFPARGQLPPQLVTSLPPVWRFQDRTAPLARFPPGVSARHSCSFAVGQGGEGGEGEVLGGDSHFTAESVCADTGRAGTFGGTRDSPRKRPHGASQQNIAQQITKQHAG